jgi:hypothetical protein
MNDTTVRAYYDTMVDMALALGAKNKTRVEHEMLDVIKFETQLANVSQAAEAIRGAEDLMNLFCAAAFASDGAAAQFHNSLQQDEAVTSHGTGTQCKAPFGFECQIHELH